MRKTSIARFERGLLDIDFLQILDKKALSLEFFRDVIVRDLILTYLGTGYLIRHVLLVAPKHSRAVLDLKWKLSCLICPNRVL